MRIAAPAACMPRWPHSALPAELAPATARLRSHLLDLIRPDGTLHSPCRSRVLESALLLALLDRARLEPPARSRLAAYLSLHCNSPEPLDRLMARAALHHRPGPAGLLDVEQFLARAPDFTGPRKRALLHAVLTLLDAAPTADEIATAPEASSLHGLHTWARVQVTAVKAVLAHARGHRLIDKGDLELLRSTQRPGTVWEANLLIHLSVLHALLPVPGQYPVVVEGVKTALQHQRPDGGMPFICDEDTWVTATAGVALHAAGAAASVMDLIARRLVALQHPAGGWSYTDGVQLPDVDCTSVAVEVLHLADPDAYRAPLRRALRALHALRGKDGGFPTYLTGAPSEACMTAAAANALSTQGPAYHHEFETAMSYLASQQRPDGSFPPDWSSSRLHTVARAVLAASHHPRRGPDSPAQHIIRKAVRLVADCQNADGGWGQQDGDASDALSTAYALTALTTQNTPGPATRGAAYLLTQQQSDGSIASIPDSIGPRPFGFTVPGLADVFTLLALGHLTRRLEPAPCRIPPVTNADKGQGVIRSSPARHGPAQAVPERGVRGGSEGTRSAVANSAAGRRPPCSTPPGRRHADRAAHPPVTFRQKTGMRR
ncbi:MULTISPECIES: prenyltransferase/squalene oxidase repeat-containing protein [Streptomyces]|uniref:prenyltransferase/squalene oxidase repeat-containing protein n=1 Tax=Streptomyces TaxID=1883 RepID=UPI00287F610F|nr:prenyltransferase/squalene oxidase repeat-containing protein [Streptomyces sp. CGMCC 4.1456]WNF65553.1 terpene cyclase/mutase family protein [Streptomyces sp. CGMCC 4.1456]